MEGGWGGGRQWEILLINCAVLKWNTHVEYICKKASKELYSLRVLKGTGVDEISTLKLNLTTVRLVLE